MKRSPFKFLDAYTLKDKDVFFGREEETDRLYQLAFQAPLILVYGLSGTGKTSLIQCGLASRYDGADWYPFFIRRQDNINDALAAALRPALGDYQPKDLCDSVSYLYRYYLRPIYLIFDQFEELFILGSAAEQHSYAESIRALVESGLPCRILLVMREEYIGQLYVMEKTIPALFDFRVRVEPMSNARIRDVIKNSCNKFNITLAAPADDRCQEMIDKISVGKSGIQLPYLQVYLDMLYRDDFQRTYGETPPEDPLPPLEFNKEEIEELGQIDDVLARFMREQEDAMEVELKAYSDNVPEDLVRRVLDVFVTEEGTKRPLALTRQGDLLTLKGLPDDALDDLDPALVSHCLQLLQNSRLLRASETSIEIAHDTLAKLIDQQRSDEQRAINEAKTRLTAAYREFGKTGEYLSRRQLISLEDYLPKIKLDEEHKKFIDDSYREAEQLEAREREEAERRAREAEERALIERKGREEAEHLQKQADKQRRRAHLFSLVNLILMVLAVIAGLYGWKQEGKARQQAEEAKKNYISFKQAQYQRARILMHDLVERGDIIRQNYPGSAIDLYEQARTVAQDHADSTEIKTIIQELNQKIDSCKVKTSI